MIGIRSWVEDDVQDDSNNANPAILELRTIFMHLVESFLKLKLMLQFLSSVVLEIFYHVAFPYN